MAYIWGKRNRRDRRSRKHDQVEPFLTEEQVEYERVKQITEDQEDEDSRRMLEIRELDTKVQEVTPVIDAYLRTPHGKLELRQVVVEMRRLKAEYHRMHPEAEEERLKALARAEAGENGPDEDLVHELEKKEKVRAIFEVFDGDGSDAMDAEELKELLAELCLPCREDDVEEFMEEMDADGSGEIDFEEFYAWYAAHASALTKGHGLAVLGLSLAKTLKNGALGLGDLAEARRIIIAHAEHEVKEKTMAQFRLFRPPNFEALAR